MTKLDVRERAEAFARKALVNDLHQEVSEATIQAVALKIVKAVGNVSTDKPVRPSTRVNSGQAKT